MVLKVLNFLEINDNEGSIKLQFNVKLQWSDARLTFFDLKSNSTTLSKNEENTIWYPRLHFKDIDHINRNIHLENVIRVHKNKSYEPFFSDRSYLYNAKLYSGKHNLLELESEKR